MKSESLNYLKKNRSTKSLLVWLGAILFISIITFSPAAKNNFINWDDNAYVFENPHLTKPIPEAIHFFFQQNYFIGNYIPITMIVYTLEQHAAGLNPFYFHRINILIHLFNVVLIFYFIYRLSEKKWLVASIVSLLFAIHPMHVESVAWISELKDVLYSFFFISGFIVYQNYLEEQQTNLSVNSKKTIFTKKKGFLLGTIFILFLLSLLSKPAALTFPFILLLLDFYMKRKITKVVWIEKIPFFIVCLILGIITLQAQKADGLLHNDYTFSQRFFFASHSFLNYFYKIFIPNNLSIFYPYPEIKNGSLSSSFYIAPMLVALLLYGVYKTLKHSRLFVFGFLFFLINLFPVLQFISVGDAIMAERYTYMSYTGLFFAFTLYLYNLYLKNERKLTNGKYLILAILISIFSTCSYYSYSRCKVWENDTTIANDLIKKHPNDWLALNNKGFILFDQKNYSEAIPYFNKAIEIKPNYVRAHINLINAYGSMNDFNNAKLALDKAIALVPKDYNLLNKKGIFLFSEQNYQEALKFYMAALEIKKDNIDGYNFITECYFELKEYDNAIKNLDEGLSYQPDNYLLLNNKGYMLFLMERYEEALNCFKASLKSKPGYSVALANLENCQKAINKAAETKP
jgi:protein O-mannosyl-transferase